MIYVGVRRANSESWKYRGALAAIVNRDHRLEFGGVDAVVDLGPLLEIFAPAETVGEYFEQALLVIEHRRDPRMPVLGVPEHQHAAVGMMSFLWRALDHREAAQRPYVVGYIAVGPVQM